MLTFVTHPNVLIDKNVPVPRWPLSEVGRARMHKALTLPWVAGVQAVYCSTEQKAIDGAKILADHLGLAFTQVEALGENDRSSTGFLPPPEFERMADAFFGNPQESVKGWERAVDAQSRVVAAVEAIARAEADREVAIVAHGAVGTLLYCHLAGVAISRRWDQPPNSGGNWFRFQCQPPQVDGWWRPIDP